MSVNTFSVNLTRSVGITLKALHITVGNCVTGGSVRVPPDTPVRSGYSLADAPKRRDAASTLINVVSCGKGQIGAHVGAVGAGLVAIGVGTTAWWWLPVRAPLHISSGGGGEDHCVLSGNCAY